MCDNSGVSTHFYAVYTRLQTFMLTKTHTTPGFTII